MTRQPINQQIPVHVVIDHDGVTMNVCRFNAMYYAKIKLSMVSINGLARKSHAVSTLPYVIVRAQQDSPDSWMVITEPGTMTSSNATIQLAIDRPGKYRIYIKESTEQLDLDSVFLIQQHALASGIDSGREVQPLLEFEVTEDANCRLSIQRTHPNGLGRLRGEADDQIPRDGAISRLTDAHTSGSLARSLDMGTYTVSRQLWADASRTYGVNHPRIDSSRFRELLRTIYGETLIHGAGTGTERHDRILRTDTIEIQFNNQSTTGGRSSLSFQERGGDVAQRMTSDEALRRTHPATMEFLLQMMAELEMTYCRCTGAWRPHFGSTRHRYAASIDVTQFRKTIVAGDGLRHEVDVYMNRNTSSDSNPLPTALQETARRVRMRNFSHEIHRYIASAKQERELGWLGGPWELKYAELGLAGPRRDLGQAASTIAINTDDTTHYHHLHISVGIDQP